MKLLAALILGLVAGFGAAWVVKPSGYAHYYETTQEILLLGNNAQPRGVLPSGSPLVSDIVLRNTVDMAWRGCVPVYFDTMDDAERLGVVQGKPLSDVTSFTLHAHPMAGHASDEP